MFYFRKGTFIPKHEMSEHVEVLQLPSLNFPSLFCAFLKDLNSAHYHLGTFCTSIIAWWSPFWWTQRIPGCFWDNAVHIGVYGIVGVEQKTLVQTRRTVHTKTVIQRAVDGIHFQMPEEKKTCHATHNDFCILFNDTDENFGGDIVTPQQNQSFFVKQTCSCESFTS